MGVRSCQLVWSDRWSDQLAASRSGESASYRMPFPSTTAYGLHEEWDRDDDAMVAELQASSTGCCMSFDRCSVP